MGAVHHDLAGEPTFEPMIQIDMEIRNFVSAWRHCDYVSTYVARMISQTRSDSVRHSNLFSSAFNELLEVAFRTRHGDGELACRVSRHGATDRIELTFPCVAEERQFYKEAVSQVAGLEARERYVSSVSGDIAPSREIVLLELAVDYNATLRVEEADGDAIKLVVDLPLEGFEH
ncbi:ubiquinone biosynthesis methyltransferase UbiE [Mesorhizobium sp. M4B.F.Ca.ET.215.01.1.1]|uniref:Ubiquinone biosynthesis methyltransferase UbiE n=1 Tax=Mesorhizobium abyssinicae TaxID=1209958 RepID=A0ABU5ATS8_9HYPH|nr:MULTISPECIES: ubiquinone biosynthesis methyltransferase UbiE [Mesorhizobium]MDX8433544.1 ubiquinone biosynthesis methyltransferase UbiE [Mesorhizobium abyssinicae]MDX8540621.1 ubiquinone biosynthesis methyltransferase UbiE [Mesorhizobium abyssinicae]RUW21812.1 ubiquinone biosynthesis methyltransferase UbiE [Mesorhizobium sp. M4B.F.Ca.ET.013.02.1.1]RUW71921.1 ubiquinone biosynthesis methyltransferase UbiE [Mesorhizobium sp. M4B.F.Ca.ET.049.02.1.2]RVD45352.1 ubiquinone biosynthesis methyltran